MNRIFLVITVSLLLVGVGNQAFAQMTEIKNTNILNPVVILETDLGNITIEFFFDDAPNHVENFIKLSLSGFYDGTIFHRIIPDFMIQGGDPNTISGDPSTWGQGGPDKRVDAEFNTIKHKRGIVSMARSADPNSGGSQFFIVHQNSNNYEISLDGKYSVFGRIVTEESFETLDKIAGVETESPNRPIDTEQVKITKVIIVNRSEISNLLELPEPERIQPTETIPTETIPTDNRLYENEALDVEFIAPEGWTLQQPKKDSPITPDIVMIGPPVDGITPSITLTISNTDDKTIDDLIAERNELFSQGSSVGLEILSQENITINGKQAYVTIATQNFETNDQSIKVKFKEVMFISENKSYVFAYGNGIDNFDNEISKFNESVNSFKILSEKGGGCLIATATFGSELSPQVQQLRELRDNHLLQTKTGTSFMNSFNEFYYSFSPYIADYERENPVFKEVVKIAITPMISSLSILNYVEMDSEESVLGYGISLIILNLGMYVAIPASVIVGIRKYI